MDPWKKHPGLTTFFFLSPNQILTKNILSPLFSPQFSILSKIREIILFSGGSRHLSTILLKDSHLFKIAESVISFC